MSRAGRQVEGRFSLHERLGTVNVSALFYQEFDGVQMTELADVMEGGQPLSIDNIHGRASLEEEKIAISIWL